MQVNKNSFFVNRVTEFDFIPITLPLEGIVQEALDHLKRQFLSLVHFDTCRNLNSIEIKKWADSDIKEMLTEDSFNTVTKTVAKLRENKFKFESANFSTHFQRVRLKGQEICHFEGNKCTDSGYTGDDGMDFCMVDKNIPTLTQKYGYQEISVDVNHGLIFTLVHYRI